MSVALKSQFTESRFNRQSILVIGLGLTGYSIINHICGGRSGVKDIEITVADTRRNPPFAQSVQRQFPEVNIVTGEIPMQRIEEFDQVISSPGIGLGDISDKPIIGDIELFARQADAPVIGITGSNGKSTVTMLVTEMLKAAGYVVKTGGNIGTPALDLLVGKAPDFYVLELSSFQLEITYSLKLACATILNISEDHMDRYDSLDDYIFAKGRIFKHAERIIINRDDARSSHVLNDCVDGDNGNRIEHSVSFGLSQPESDNAFGIKMIDGIRHITHRHSILVAESQALLQGEQNMVNIMAAMALVSQAGVALSESVIKAAVSYRGLPHRCEIVTESGGVKWINDSKGTNVGATVAAIKGLKGGGRSQRIILIAGGRGKGADFQPLSKEIAEGVEHTILFGEDAEKISNVLTVSSSRTLVQSLDEAVQKAFTMACRGDVVLFSPACASFDMFESFEHRGDVFKQLIMEYLH